MKKFVLWGSTEGFAQFVVSNTLLNDHDVEYRYLPESDISKPKIFHELPTHIKNIQYLDSPDLIIELNSKAILSIEQSTEAGTGHNSFQRFSRIAAAVENSVPAIYIYPEAVKVYRNSLPPTWDSINPLVFYAFKKLSKIFPKTPALFYYYPSYYRESIAAGIDPVEVTQANKGIKRNRDVPVIDEEMRSMFKCINKIIEHQIVNDIELLVDDPLVAERLKFMENQYTDKAKKPYYEMSPLTSVITVPSQSVIDYIISQKQDNRITNDYFNHSIWDDRKETIIYKVNAKFRGDPYPGALAAIDYMLARTGKTYEERIYNVVLAWGNVIYDSDTGILSIDNTKGYKQSIKYFMNIIKNNHISNNILAEEYENIEFEQIPRYFMQVRFGSTYSKPKDIRIYSYFSDAILFNDGALWRKN